MLVIGHRGAKGLAPENTLMALQKGLEHHADMLEFDLRVSKDGMVVLHHDPYITDPNGDKHTIMRTNYAMLLNHKPNLATFEQVLKSVSKDTRLFVEIKPNEPLTPIIALCKFYLSYGGSEQNVMFASFSQKVLIELHTAFPNIQTIVLEKWSGVRATYA